uniref:Uncharacterized protein n=1 Tax=Arundo donax TaxID=35708 RepID=A0A0A9CER6_ARUDO
MMSEYKKCTHVHIYNAPSNYIIWICIKDQNNRWFMMQNTESILYLPGYQQLLV